MEIIHTKPPIWEDIIAAGMHPSEKTTVVTYGDKLYVPSGSDVPDHLMVHEETHAEQQGKNPDKWWSRYLDDQFFRIEQETEAYANQYAFICAHVHDRNQRSRFLYSLASTLSSPTYGSVISHANAMRKIKERSGVKP